MATVIDPARSLHADRTRVSALPERLDSNGAGILAALDAGALCAAAVLAQVAGRDPRAVAATLLTLAATAFAAGRYGRSFAIAPRHELYAAIAVSIVALPFAAAACVMLETSWLATAVALLLGCIGLAVSGVYACRSRRKTGPAFVPFTHEISRDGRVRARSLRLRATLRALDLVLGIVASIVFAPVMIVVALAVLVDSGRPVFFSQRRVGRDDRDFIMWKFRTLRRGAGNTWVAPGDERVTRAGAFLRRTSLDELPQLFNVLRGEMSLAGARPEMREYADAFEKQATNYPDRHILRPGITGWAQLHCPRNLQPSDMPLVLAHDLFFVQNISVHLYVLCLVQTAFEVVTHQAV